MPKSKVKKSKPAPKAGKKAPAKKSVARKSATVKKAPKKAAKKAVAVKKPAKKPAKKVNKVVKMAAKKTAAKKVVKKAAPKDKQAPKAAPKSSKTVKSAPKPSKPAAKAVKTKKPVELQDEVGVRPVPKGPVKMTPFLKSQREKLLHLRDGVLDSMNGVARDTLRSRAEGSEASAFGMHQADAGSDAYDRDFALSLISQEQDALYEIDEALKRIELGTYGICEMSGKAIPQARLEALPFARLSVECQSQVEKQRKLSKTRQPVTSLFGLTDDEAGESEDEEATPESKE